MRRAVFLDRDGVINRSIVRDGVPYAPRIAEEFEILPGVAAALEKLRGAGYLNIVVTNQPDLSSGKQVPGFVEALHRRLSTELALDAIMVCPHADADRCSCRKPQPGLLTRSANDWGIDLSGSFMVGDRWRDIAAGQRAGCRCYFIDYGYKEERPTEPYVTVTCLGEAAEGILSD